MNARESSDFQKIMMPILAKYVTTTSGDKESELYTKEGHFQEKINHVLSIIDPVGAGVTYFSMLAVGIIKDGSLPECCPWHPCLHRTFVKLEAPLPNPRNFMNP